MKGLVPLIKIATVIAVLALAIIATLYTLDIVADQAAKDVLVKVMAVLGIWTGASVVTLLVAALGSPPPPPSSKPAP